MLNGGRGFQSELIKFFDLSNIYNYETFVAVAYSLSAQSTEAARCLRACAVRGVFAGWRLKRSA